MKHKLMLALSSLILLIVISLSVGCVSTLTPSGRVRHQRRHIWVNKVYYEQVYYINGSNETVIVSQKEIPHKKYKEPKKKHHNNRGNHGNH